MTVTYTMRSEETHDDGTVTLIINRVERERGRTLHPCWNRLTRAEADIVIAAVKAGKSPYGVLLGVRTVK